MISRHDKQLDEYFQLLHKNRINTLRYQMTAKEVSTLNCTLETALI